ncbi:MAG: hypothetical protein SH850_25450 [Planctomycetaceae bacterium]|nr:hypothetical protein [Planctomycetaceae bacterium]
MSIMPTVPLTPADPLNDSTPPTPPAYHAVACLTTPDEIASACADIRAGWSTYERFRRQIGPSRVW